MMKTLLEVGLKIQEILVVPKLRQVLAKLKDTIKQTDFSPVEGDIQVHIISQMIKAGCITFGDRNGMQKGEENTTKKHGWGQDRYYTSPAGSDYSGKSVGKYRSYSSTPLHEGDKRYDSDRHELTQHKNESGRKNRERSYEETNKTKEPDRESTLDDTGQTESGTKRNLPQNLVNIFNQIAEFEREKGSKQKKQQST